MKKVLTSDIRGRSRASWLLRHEKNLVLSILSSTAQEFISSKSVVKPLLQGQVIYEDQEPFTHGVFPHSGVISLTGQLDDGRWVEKASIGVEGFLGLAMILGGGHALSRSIVQVAGEASWLSTEALNEAMERFPCVRKAILQYTRALIAQLLETVLCSSNHSATNRISTWLLLANDRTDGCEISIRQESLATALGLRRATVSGVFSALQGVGAISYVRGKLEVTNREKLLEQSCRCYSRIHGASLFNVTNRILPTIGRGKS